MESVRAAASPPRSAPAREKSRFFFSASGENAV